VGKIRFSKLDYDFMTFMGEDLDNLNYTGNDASFALDLVAEIDNKISSISTEIELDKRPNKNSGKKIGISQIVPNKDREKFSILAREIIEKHPDLELGPVPDSRKEKDYAIQYKDMSKYIYVSCRPDGKRSGAGADPNELMTAALCLKSKLKIPTTVEEMDKLIDDVRLSLKKVKGYKQNQVESLTGDYGNLCQAVSAAKAIHDAGYGGADIVYLTGQAWDDDVKQFKITKYGMSDFNSSDFIVKKGKSYLGVSLKKKARLSEEDPTLINKAFTSLFQDSKFDKIMKDLDDKVGLFYLKVLARGKREGKLSKSLLADMQKTRPNTKNWKQFIQRVDNDLINRELKSSRSLFKDMSDIIMNNKLLIANQLIQLIFKADLKDLKEHNFDFALVTGIGGYGPKKGVAIEQGDYKNIDTITTKLDDLASKGSVDLVFTPGKTQPFEEGATAAILKFDLLMNSVPLCNISLRYKGNFRAAPLFLATMTDEFKAMYK
jgi:hypothetical protein